MLDTLYYLKKGGRITPAAAALGTLLRLKPVLQIQGEKLDAFAKARTSSQGKNIMINAIKADIENRFGGTDKMDVHIACAYTKDLDSAEQWKSEIEQAFPGMDVYMDPLSLSVACHIGPGALAITATRKLHI
jgi:DegV family protein with EDD domain